MRILTCSLWLLVAACSGAEVPPEEPSAEEPAPSAEAADLRPVVEGPEGDQARSAVQLDPKMPGSADAVAPPLVLLRADRVPGLTRRDTGPNGFVDPERFSSKARPFRWEGLPNGAYTVVIPSTADLRAKGLPASGEYGRVEQPLVLRGADVDLGPVVVPSASPAPSSP